MGGGLDLMRDYEYRTDHATSSLLLDIQPHTDRFFTDLFLLFLFFVEGVAQRAPLEKIRREIKIAQI